MRHVAAPITALVVFAFAFAVAGCTTGPGTPASTSAPRTAGTSPAPRASAPPVSTAPTPLPNAAATELALAPAPQLSTPTTLPSETPVPETSLPTSTPAPPTPVIPPGLYVTYLNTQPDPPVRGAQLEFHIGFANDTSSTQDFRWIVYIYAPDNPTHSFGETTVTRTQEPPGAHEIIGLGYWKLPLGGPCEDYIARVAWLDQDNRAAQFKEPNGQLFEKILTICPP